MLISLSSPLIPYTTGYTTESVIHGQCDARPTYRITFPDTEHYHLPLFGRHQIALLGDRGTCVPTICLLPESLRRVSQESKLLIVIASPMPNHYTTKYGGAEKITLAAAAV